MRIVIIYVNDDDTFIVQEGQVNAGLMNWDEMLGQVAAMTMRQKIKERSYVYPMRTASEHEAINDPIEDPFGPT